MNQMIDPSLNIHGGIAAEKSWRHYWALTKPRLVALVILNAMVGFWLALPYGWEWMLSIEVLIATALVAGGAMALNQWMERDIDAKMLRTQHRPVASGRLAPSKALFFGVTLSLLGFLAFAALVNGLSAFIAFLTSLSYLACYTPLKQKTSYAVFVGAFPGALPPVLGWVSAAGKMSSEAVILFLIVFFWQMPHFLAIAWLYRNDYAKAGLPMLSVLDKEGTRVAREMITHACALIPTSLLLSLFGATGKVYFFGAFLLGLLFSGTIIYAASNLDARAKYVFRASVIYLSLLFLLMLVDKR